MRLTVSIAWRMAECGDTLESLERWENEAGDSSENLR